MSLYDLTRLRNANTLSATPRCRPAIQFLAYRDDSVSTAHTQVIFLHSLSDRVVALEQESCEKPTTPMLGAVPFDIGFKKSDLLSHLADAVLDDITNRYHADDPPRFYDGQVTKIA